MKVFRPIPATHLPKIWELLQQFAAGMVDDYSPQTFEQLQQTHTELLAAGKSYSLTDDAGELLGALWFNPMGDGMYLGHLVFAAHQAKQRTENTAHEMTPAEKMQATRAVLAHLFRDGARKVSWKLFADNRAFSIFLRRMGASIEGQLKQATRRNGELVDVVLMATFPEDLQ